MIAFIIPVMSFFSRLHGASWTPKWIPSAVLWGLSTAYFAESSVDHSMLFVVWGYIAIQLGHGRFYEMKGANISDPNLEEIEKWLNYKGDITKPLYSWVCMGFKGLLIGLPFGFAGLANAVLWPFSYYIGMRIIKDGAYAEILAGAFLGLLIMVG